MKNKKNIFALVLMLAVALPLVLFTTGCAKSKEKYTQILEGKGYTVTERTVSGDSKAESIIRAVYEKDGVYGDVTLYFYSNHTDSQEGYNKAREDVARTKLISSSYDFTVYWTGNVVMVGNEKGLKDAK